MVLNGGKSRWLETEQWFRQGCSLSYLIYIYLIGMAEELESSARS